MSDKVVKIDARQRTVPAKKTLEEQLRCVERELAMRGNVFPKLIQKGRMKPAEAEHEILAMMSVHSTLKACEHLAGVLEGAVATGASQRYADSGGEEANGIIEMTSVLALQIAKQLRGG